MKKTKDTAICSHCGRQMHRISLRKALARLARGLYSWYSCYGTKINEGCGHALIVKNVSKHKKKNLHKRSVHAVKDISFVPTKQGK